MAALLLGLGATAARATTAQEINLLPVLDPLNEETEEEPWGWGPLAWSEKTHPTGKQTASGWTFWTTGFVSGGYWEANPFNDESGEAASFTMQTAPGAASSYVGLWLNMPNPETTKTGYQLRWTLNSGSNYKVTLSKWSAGTETVIASNASVTITAGTTMAISDTGGTVSAWKGTGGSLTSILSASDTTYSSGYAGIEALGNTASPSYSINFKAGPLMGAAVGKIGVLDNLERNESPIATGKWSKTNWASQIGTARMGSYRGYGSTSGSLAGAYWNPKIFNSSWGGTLVSGTVGTGATPTGQYLALWLNMLDPATARSGLEARFTGNGSSTNYKVELSKWSSGTRTVLASTTGFSLPVGTTMALTKTGNSIVLWTGTGGTLTPVLSATTSGVQKGYAGLEVSGSAGTIYNFKAGRVGVVQPVETTITSGPEGGVAIPRLRFSFSGSPAEAVTGFECSFDGSAYATCTSPKSYVGVSEGSHTFKVRSVGSGNVDETPAERSVQVVSAEKAVSKVELWDNLERSESPLATGKWSKTNWVSEIGTARMGGYHGYGSSSGSLAGAYWNPGSFGSDSSGTNLVSGIVGTGITTEGQYLALWLDMPTPASTRSGYEARFTGNGSPNSYKVELSKWSSGTRTVLASTTGFSLPVGTTMALTETPGGDLAVWTGTSTLTTVLTASDSTYTTGYSGLEVSGSAGTIYNFRAGWIDIVPPDTHIFSGPGFKEPTEEIPSASAIYQFQAEPNDPGTTFQCSLDGGAYSACSSPKEYSGFAEGIHEFRVRAVDSVGNQDETPDELSFQFNTPPETTITSGLPTYLSNEPPPPVSFTSNDPKASFSCSLDGGSYTSCKAPYTIPGSLSSGWHSLAVRAVDDDGAPDPSPEKWTFNTGIYPPAPATSKLVSPEEGTKSNHYLTLKAQWGSPPKEGGGVTGVTFQALAVGEKQFKTIPSQYVLNSKGEQVSWPLPVSSNPGESEQVYFDARSYPPVWEGIIISEKLKIRAVFDGGTKAAGASAPVQAELSVRNSSPSNAVATVGPATVDLLTGYYTMSKTDVSIPIPGSEAMLEFQRTYSSNYIGQNVGSEVLDGAWQPSLPAEQGGSGQAWRALMKRHVDATEPEYDPECLEEEGTPEECMIEEALPAADWVEVLDSEEAGISFDKVGGSYVSPDYGEDWILTEESATHFRLTDVNGTQTVFVQNGASDEYTPRTVSWQSSEESLRMVYEFTSEALMLIKVIGPAAAGITCSDSSAETTVGCRTLTFQYKEGLLSSITYHNASGQNPQVVSKYGYDSHARLIEQWDPRISPNLKETYTYSGISEGSRLLQTVTSPGEEPYEFGYDETFYTTRLRTVKRDSLVAEEPVAQTTIVYDVPLSGEDAPYDMSPATLSEWGQTDYPVDATAIFPPDQIPDSPPDDYSHATVHYLDPDGYEVNVASAALPGASGSAIATSETDEHGNVVRKLSPEQRLMALADENPVERSQELETKWVYQDKGTELAEEWGPLHEVKLDSGETVQARAHTQFFYDEGAPEASEGTPEPHLVTKQISGARIPGQSSDVDVRESKTVFDWDLRKPTEAITDPEGLNLRYKTFYDKNTGLLTEKRQPSNQEGGGAGTTKFLYYTVKDHPSDSSCGNQPAWAGLVCKEKPAAQASPAEGNPQLLVIRYASYNSLDQPATIVESPGGEEKAGKTRTITFTYDSAGRPVSTKVSGGGESLPATKTSYHSETGRPYMQELVCEGSEEECEEFDSQAVTTTYDTLGRAIEYEDADGNLSGVAYDLLGRPVLSSDGKGTQIMSYDEETGAAVQLVDSQAGTFTAEYDADGNMTKYTLPNGLAMETTYDATGAATQMSYEKTTYCQSNCTWLEFEVKESIYGQWLKEESDTATEEYAYDKAGRLTLAKDIEAGKCTTRSYSYDANSNRSKLITRPPEAGGSCSSSGGTTQNYSYDTGDRLIGAGVVYDDFGRITSLADAYSGGGTYTASYYSSDMLRSQSQDGVTNTYYLDATQRQRGRVQTGGESPETETYHYSGGDDSPDWIQEGSEWSRSIEGMDGNLAAVYDSASEEAVLQLTDLHGDVIATASLDPQATEPLSSQDFDEFGNPKQEGSARFGWLGARQRRTELASGIIQMGVRAYVPALGRFTTPDSVAGGSANDYDYANADPVNGEDLDGMRGRRGKKKRGRRPGVAKASRRAGGGRRGPRRPRLLLKAGSCNVWMHRPKGEYGLSVESAAPREGLHVWGSVTMRGDCGDYMVSVGLECYCSKGTVAWRPALTPGGEGVTNHYAGFGAGESGGEMQSQPALMDPWDINCVNGVARFRTTAMITKRGSERPEDSELIPFSFVRRVPC